MLAHAKAELTKALQEVDLGGEDLQEKLNKPGRNFR